jgi:hypothetical protein
MICAPYRVCTGGKKTVILLSHRRPGNRTHRFLKVETEN